MEMDGDDAGACRAALGIAEHLAGPAGVRGAVLARAVKEDGNMDWIGVGVVFAGFLALIIYVAFYARSTEE